MGFQRVATLADVPAGRGLRVEVAGVAVGLFRVGEAVHAMEDACPHAEASLSAGALEGPVVTCARHGWRFDVRTGHRPEDADGFPIPCFAVRVHEGAVWVDLEQPLNRRGRRGAGPG